VLIGTVLQGTRTQLRTWIAVVRAREHSGRTPTVADLMSGHGLSRDGARQLVRRVDRALGDMRAAGPDDLLTVLLRIPADEAARVRQATPPRVRPRPQRGPTADHG
jgi:hypothetical protein